MKSFSALLALALVGTANAAATITATPTWSVGAQVAVTKSNANSYLCWKTALTSATPAVSGSCASLSAGTATAFGDASTTAKCTAASTATSVTLNWDTLLQVKINIIECSAAGTNVGSADDSTITPSLSTAVEISSTGIKAVGQKITSVVAKLTHGATVAIGGTIVLTTNSDVWSAAPTCASSITSLTMTTVRTSSGVYTITTAGAATGTVAHTIICTGGTIVVNPAVTAPVTMSVTAGASTTGTGNFALITPVAASTAVGVSCATTTLVAGAATTVEFVTTALLTATTDTLFVKIVASTTTCAAAAGTADAVAGGTCTLAQKTSGTATAGTCSITITSTVAASTGNKWCTGKYETGAYAALTTAGTTATTAAVTTSSATTAGAATVALAAAGVAVAMLA